MKKNKYAAYLLLCLLSPALPACRQPAPKKLNTQKAVATQPPASAKEEDRAVNMVMNLPEVKQASQEIEKGSNGKHHLAVYVDTPPTNTDPNYWVKVAEDNGGSLVTDYMFTVDGKTHQIKYYDTAQDTLVTLDQWRKTKTAP